MSELHDNLKVSAKAPQNIPTEIARLELQFVSKSA